MAEGPINENIKQLFNPKTITHKNFKKLDIVEHHDGNILVLDYARDSGIHILNKDMEYIGNISCREKYAVGLTVLSNNKIGILQTNTFSIYEKVSNVDEKIDYKGL